MGANSLTIIPTITKVIGLGSHLNQHSQALGGIIAARDSNSPYNPTHGDSLTLGTATLGSSLFPYQAVWLTSTAGIYKGGSDISGGTPTGVITSFGGITLPSGWLLCDGSAVSRATYSSLFSAITATIGTFTVTIASPGLVTLNSHGLITGDRVSATTTGALPTGLSVSTNYFVIKNDTNSFWLATTYTNALAGTKINTSGTQSGTHTLLYNPYGISGASNFLVPDLRAATLRGSGTSTLYTQNQTINIGGIQDDQMQGHYHSANSMAKYDPFTNGTYLAGGDPGAGGSGSYTPSITSPSSDGTNGTPRTGNETRMKNIGVQFIIKY